MDFFSMSSIMETFDDLKKQDKQDEKKLKRANVLLNEKYKKMSDSVQPTTFKDIEDLKLNIYLKYKRGAEIVADKQTHGKLTLRYKGTVYEDDNALDLLRKVDENYVNKSADEIINNLKRKYKFYYKDKNSDNGKIIKIMNDIYGLEDISTEKFYNQIDPNADQTTNFINILQNKYVSQETTKLDKLINNQSITDKKSLFLIYKYILVNRKNQIL